MSRSDITIEHLNLRLPNQLSGRANAIGRELVKQLGNIEMHHSAQLDVLDLPAVRLHGGESNQVVARKIAGSMQQQITHHIRQRK